MVKNGFLTLLFAFIPGAGQMYQGYAKRGLSLAGIFAASLVFADVFYSPLACVALVAWMYSFFDALNLRSQLLLDAAPQDDYLIHVERCDSWLRELARKNQHTLLGWGLVALGVLIAYENIIMELFGDLLYRFGQNSAVVRLIYLALNRLPTVLFCVALIWCGMRLVRGPRGDAGAAAAPDADSPDYRADVERQQAFLAQSREDDDENE